MLEGVDLTELDLHLSVLAASSSSSPKGRRRQPAEPMSTASTPPGLDTHHSVHTGPPTSKGTPRTESEIIVRIDGMDMDSDMNSLPDSALPDETE